MSKYIDAEKLYKKVDELMAHYAQSKEDMDEIGDTDWATYYQGKRTMCSEILDIITFLQQEQPEVDEQEYGPYARQYPKSKVNQEQPKVDLEKDIEKVCDFNKAQTTVTMTKGALRAAAYHFYELGLKAKKE